MIERISDNVILPSVFKVKTLRVQNKQGVKSNHYYQPNVDTKGITNQIYRRISL